MEETDKKMEAEEEERVAPEEGDAAGPPTAAGPEGATAYYTRSGRPKQRHRLTREEVRLVAETFQLHKHESWAVQVDAYNAAARERGWFDQVKLATYTTRCSALRQELAFKADAGGGELNRKWLGFEDEELGKWDWKGKVKARYPAFIEHMRAAHDPSYFRSVMSILSRLATLGINAQRAPVKKESMEEEEEEDKMDGEEDEMEGVVAEKESDKPAERGESTGDPDNAESRARSARPPSLKRRRLSKGEKRLVVETFLEHQHESWAAQAAAYNAEARQRGWFHEVKPNAFMARCKALKREQQLEADAGADQLTTKWLAFEDEELGKWDWRGNVSARFPAFIEHMRSAYDSSYYRSVMAISSRLTTLGIRAQPKTEEAGVEMEHEDGAASQLASPGPSSLLTTVEGQVIQTTASPPSVILDGASSDGGSGDGRPDIEPALDPVRARELLESKLLSMQTLLRSADAALFGGSSPSSSSPLIATHALQNLHSRLQAMVSDAIAAVSRSTSDRSGGSSSKPEVPDFAKVQSTTLLNILNAKVEAAEARAGALEAEHNEYRDWAEEHIAELRTRRMEVEAVKIELQRELHKCRNELACQATAARAATDRGMTLADGRSLLGGGEAHRQGQEYSIKSLTNADTHDGDKNLDPGAARGTKRSSKVLTGASDQFFDPKRAGPSLQQRQLAYLLASANRVIDLT